MNKNEKLNRCSQKKNSIALRQRITFIKVFFERLSLKVRKKRLG